MHFDMKKKRGEAYSDEYGHYIEEYEIPLCTALKWETKENRWCVHWEFSQLYGHNNIERIILETDHEARVTETDIWMCEL